MANAIVTPELRISYARLLEPAAAEAGGELKYSVLLPIPKETAGGAAFLKKLNQRIEEVIIDKWGKRPPGLTIWMNDGDDPDDDREEYRGCMLINAKSKRRPGIVVYNEEDQENENLTPLDEYCFASGKSAEEIVYSGTYARVSVMPFAYEWQKKKGVSFGLNNVMITKPGEGEPYVGSTAKQDFKDLVD